MTRTILLLAANPKNTPRLRLDQEAREISNGLQRAQRRDEFILRQEWAVRPIDIRRAMLEYQPSIVHFCGHGDGEEGLAFEDETGQAKLVGGTTLADFFKLFSDKVECVVLNACYSEIQAEAIAQHINYVVGMRKSIGDISAIEFSVAFYDALGAGGSIEFAYELACNALQWLSISEHLTPILKSKKLSDEQKFHIQRSGKWIMTLSATINEVDRPLAEMIVENIKRLSRDSSLTLHRIEAGSVKLYLAGSRDGFERIEAFLRAGQLRDILGVGIKGIQWESDRRVVVLIDGDYLTATVNKLGVNLDFAEFRDALKSMFGTTASFNYYAQIDPSSGTELTLRRSLTDLQYRVYIEPWKSLSTELQMISDAVEKIDEFDTFVIVSGDKDFAHLVENLRMRSKQVVIVSSPNATSLLLTQNASKYISLAELLPQAFSRKA